HGDPPIRHDAGNRRRATWSLDAHAEDGRAAAFLRDTALGQLRSRCGARCAASAVDRDVVVDDDAWTRDARTGRLAAREVLRLGAMESLLGRIATLVVRNIDDDAAWLSATREQGREVLIPLPSAEMPSPLEVGASVEVFVYLDSNDQPIATTRSPKLRLG